MTKDAWGLAMGGASLVLVLGCGASLVLVLGCGAEGGFAGLDDLDLEGADPDGPVAHLEGAAECGDGASGAVFVAVDGDDANDGSEAAPFGTLEHAIDVALPGDTIWVRGGTYLLDGPVVLDKSGLPGEPIKLWAYDGEIPILDFSSNPRHADPPQPRDDDSIAATADALGLYVAGGSEWWHVRGLTIRNAPYYGVRVYGSSNVFERLVIHDNKASGLEITGKEGWTPSSNLVLDCDSFHNFDPQSNGEDADGFAAKFDSLGPNNVFRRTRAWSNSDDGYDLWHAAPVELEECWAFDNGFNRPEWVPHLSGSFQGDGIGFKLGQDGDEHVLRRVVAWGNKGLGIDDNGNGSAGGVTIHGATLVNNSKNGNPLQLSLDDGRPHTVRNTIAFDVDGPGVVSLSAEVDSAFNTWDGPGVSAADFVDLDMAVLLALGSSARLVDGSLPAIGLRLDPSSSLVDAGVDVGLPFAGAAPDLGAFETTP